jgi:hypothetical protein
LKAPAVLWAQGHELSIYQIQYTTSPDGTSDYNGSIVDCRGGIVVFISTRTRPRLVLYDPEYPAGWGGITAKDKYSSGAFDGVQVGDWVSFTNVAVEDFRGTTFLQYTAENNSALAVVSTGNHAPRPLKVGADEIAAPIEGADNWLTGDHSAERYEGMLVKVADATVSGTGYGKAYDNYILQTGGDSGPECWATDYLNDDASAIYHPLVETGMHFCGVSGIVEQYTGNDDGIDYDYYQLLTTDTGDFTIDQTADLDEDCDVDFADFAAFAPHWLEQGCSTAGSCGGADLVEDAGDAVNGPDLMEFARHWLE